jgi:hypothetical protein
MAIDYANYAAATRLAATINPAIHLLLRDPTDLLVLCQNRGRADRSGSAVDRVPTVDFDDAMTAPSEGGSLSATDPTVSSITITIARQALRRDQTDLYGLTGSGGMLNMLDPAMIAMDARNAAIKRRTAMIATLFSSVSGQIDRSGQALTFTDLLQAQFALQTSRVPAPYACVLFPHQHNNLQSSLRGEGGPLQFQGATAEMIAAKGPGYAGSLGNIDYWTSDQVPADSTDRVGCLFGAGAFAFREADARAALAANPNMAPMAMTIPAGSPIFVEFERNADTASTEIVYNYYFGVSEQEDARAQGIKSAGS